MILRRYRQPQIIQLSSNPGRSTFGLAKLSSKLRCAACCQLLRDSKNTGVSFHPSRRALVTQKLYLLRIEHRLWPERFGTQRQVFILNNYSRAKALGYEYDRIFYFSESRMAIGYADEIFG